MFILEHSTQSEKFKQYITNPKALMPFSWSERLMGMLFWPVLLGVFFYFFPKQFFK